MEQLTDVSSELTSVGERLEYLRKRLGLSREGLQAALRGRGAPHSSVMTIRRNESGARSPTVDEVVALAALADVRAGWVVEGGPLDGPVGAPSSGSEDQQIIGHVRAELMRDEETSGRSDPALAIERVGARLARLHSKGEVSDAGWGYWLALREGALLTGTVDPWDTTLRSSEAPPFAIHEAVAGGSAEALISTMAARCIGGAGKDALDPPIDSVERLILVENLPPETRPFADAVLRALHDPVRLPQELFSLGESFMLAGFNPEAASVNAMAYNVATRLDLDVEAIEAARMAGRCHRRLAEWDAALAWYTAARGLAESIGDNALLAEVLDGTGHIYVQRGAHPTARQFFRDAWAAATASGDPKALASVSHSLAIAENKAGNLTAAAEWATISLGAQTEPERRAVLLVSVGTFLLEGGDTRTAAEAYLLARDLSVDRSLRMMATDAIAYCAALEGDEDRYAHWRDRSRLEARASRPYYRAQFGYYRGAALRALGHERNALRVLRAVERYARVNGISEYEVKAAALAELESALPGDFQTPEGLIERLKSLREATR